MSILSIDEFRVLIYDLFIAHMEEEMKTFICCLTIGLWVAMSVQAEVTVWRSSEDGVYSIRESALVEPSSDQTPLVVKVDSSLRYQPILGLGASFEHASCYNLMKLDEATREETLRRLFHPEQGIGMNLMRVCIGTSDFVGEPWYSYNDTPGNEPDPDLEHFSIEKDKAYVLPIIKRAQEINPDIKLVAAPWSAPAWMKTNQSMLAGQLNPEYHDAFARYLAKFVKAYEEEGVSIFAITPQNEPDYPNPEYPTTYWSGHQQRIFIRDYLGPVFEREGLDTEIWCWDHNWHLLDFPRTILNDPEAAAFVDGVAFHLYEGDVTAQTELHMEFPDVPIYFTEGSTFETRGAVEIIQILRNWSRSYNAWVVMLDENRLPNNGPHDASETMIVLQDDLTVRYTFDYYMYGHFMKFIPRDSVRIESSPSTRDFGQIVFERPDGTFVMVAANPSEEPVAFTVEAGDTSFTDVLYPRRVATYEW